MPQVCNTADTPNSPGFLPSYIETWESLRVKENLTSVGFQPTTSGLDLPMLCRLSYESSRGAGRGTIEVVNPGKCARDYQNNLLTNDVDDENIFDKCLSAGGRQYCRYKKPPWIIPLLGLLYRQCCLLLGHLK